MFCAHLRLGSVQLDINLSGRPVSGLQVNIRGFGFLSSEFVGIRQFREIGGGLRWHRLEGSDCLIVFARVSVITRDRTKYLRISGRSTAGTVEQFFGFILVSGALIGARH